jgi:hypothetical protein
MPTIEFEDLTGLAPDELLGCSGKVFYTGHAAFEREAAICMLGLTPGGRPATQAEKTLRAGSDQVRAFQSRSGLIVAEVWRPSRYWTWRNPQYDPSAGLSELLSTQALRSRPRAELKET